MISLSPSSLDSETSAAARSAPWPRILRWTGFASFATALVGFALAALIVPSWMSASYDDPYAKGHAGYFFVRMFAMATFAFGALLIGAMLLLLAARLAQGKSTTTGAGVTRR